MNMETSSPSGESIKKSKRKKRTRVKSTPSDEDDPLATDPLATDPLATDPIPNDPLAIDPLARVRVNSISSDKNFLPAWNDPLAKDPLANEEYESNTEKDDSDSHSSSDEESIFNSIQYAPFNSIQRNSTPNLYLEEEKLLIENVDCNNPLAVFKIFFTDYIAEIMVEETNKYAEQCMNSVSNRRKNWKPVTRDEINTFVGILLIMGVVQLPKLRLYWCKRAMYMNTCIKRSMLRDRFLSILRYLHFSDDSTAQIEDRLQKIRNIVEKTFVCNNEKTEGDLSKQLLTYYTCLWKRVKWYQKIIIELICGTCLINAWYINQKWGTNYINILKFRERIIYQLLPNDHDVKKMKIETPAIPNKELHFLEQYKEPSSKSRKRCKQCYKRLSENKGRVCATRTAKKVSTYCNGCEGQPPLCFECFKELHS
ncbi:uncharacterized protein LOC128885450 [Hylaeus anthracinus]|uniref:uncharacterized protein LOC128885450 n=1 Tax=Hylaeus anthracinus TaxID=313031 RepID=UPI0023B934E2|nr:uncharacterized protein LOC128885450 [Hylaeus anthracinus]XP_053995483.1 uncharacterized protein LOC128885450 [Hylaeus anthracinus]